MYQISPLNPLNTSRKSNFKNLDLSCYVPKTAKILSDAWQK